MSDVPGRGWSREMPPAYRFVKATFTVPVQRVFRVNAEGAERINVPHAFILASNHASWLDPLVLGSLTSRALSYLGHSGLFENPTVGRVLREQGRVIGVDREHGGNRAAFELAVAALKEGRVVGIFPEGHRTRDGRLLPFHSGAARLALSSGAPIVPAALSSFWTWPRHSPVPDLSSRLGVSIGEPMDVSSLEGLQEDRDVCRKVTDDLRERIEALMVRAMALREG